LDLTDDKPAALVALASINFEAGFADLNLSKSLFNVLSRLDSRQGKKTVVLLSSGIDTSPPLVPEDFLARLSTTDVRILAIGTSKLLTQTPKHHVLSQEQKSGRANLQSSLVEGETKLRELAAATGGRTYFPKSLKDFDKTYAEIAQLVRHEYNLAFVPQTFDGKVHSLSVTAKQAHRLDHRQAYLAPVSQAN
jgi:VWFA-related protein